MDRIITKYLRQRRENGPWELSPKPSKSLYDSFIVIPAYSEFESLPKTLNCISEQSFKLLENTLVVVVVNNKKEIDKPDFQNNQDTLTYLQNTKFKFEVSVIDASSQGLVLPEKFAGVGLARKIGMDLCLPLSNPDSFLCCTDADTLLSPNYLNTIHKYFANHKCQSAVVGFEHQKSDNPEIESAIRAYENFLKTTAEKTRQAGSPYGYHAIGSTIVCSAKAYIAVGGMSRKKATEDFYFLQELAKYSKVHTIEDILVFPSSRPSNRIYLGTGFRMNQAQSGYDLKQLNYSDDAFVILKKWLKLGQNSFKSSLEFVLEKANNIHIDFKDFLIQEGISNVWGGIQKSSPTEIHFQKQFHRWFDALKTIRLLKIFSQNNTIE
ncbi:MAG: glycosyltransferase family 2 protein [Candidatus Marinimicrobia bacterium]|nr:glycosyltransferase family 2 protein [Candidatus Neomarinimicrobiota bacterium]MBL7022836.1 glycosyltransferase family 2 protein [Candidatus Neomarinimicrobiota bacterium]MBL7109443.1 glycosyltransferase family 2 protein [Candidatus Neomarinimicrobiota bacterium]